MPTTPDNNTAATRRTFLVSTTAAGLLAASTSACQDGAMTDGCLLFATFNDALREVDRLSKLPTLKTAAVWTWPQTLTHCAQSIEYSMTGFPQSKSALFQSTAGALALKAFTWRGRMRHDLAEPIPGAPSLDTSTDATLAIARLQKAVADFQANNAPLRPHFAYGELDKAAYEQAHAMHLANHLSGFDTPA